MSLARIKENLRAEFAMDGLTREEGNRAAEQLRRLPAYRRAGLLFVSPAPCLQQIRTNVLADGKELLMPGPGLKEGFYLLKPYSLPFSELARAVTMKGLGRYGRRLDRETLGHQAVDMMLADAVAVDEAGCRLGRGHGFFDLTCAILQELDAVAANALRVGVVSAGQIRSERLPCEAWDVRFNLLVTPEGCREIRGENLPLPALYWEMLPERRIRKLKPLWQLFQDRELKS